MPPASDPPTFQIDIEVIFSAYIYRREQTSGETACALPSILILRLHGTALARIRCERHGALFCISANYMPTASSAPREVRTVCERGMREDTGQPV